MANYIQGNLKEEYHVYQYTGLESTTARVEVDNNEQTIAVNVLFGDEDAEKILEKAEEITNRFDNLSSTATVDNAVGTPSVDVDLQLVEDSYNINFDFHNLKGETGETGPQGEQGPQGPQGDPATNLVQSVNGKQGTVVLGASDVGALPSSTTYVSSVNGQSGAVTVADEIFIAEYGVTTLEEIDAAYNSGKIIFAECFGTQCPLQGKDSSHCSFIACYEVFDTFIIQLYSVGVNNEWSIHDLGLVETSRTINNKALSSNITLTASDVGALPSSTSIPTKTSQLTNDSDYIDSLTAGNIAQETLAIYASDVKHLAIIYVNGSQAALVDTESNPISFQDFYAEYTQNWTVLVGSFLGSEYELRVWEGVYSNALTQEVTLASVDDSMVYFVHLQDSGNGLVGTYSTVTIPKKTSDLTNDSGFITSAQAPVQSVNGQTGTVSIAIPTVPTNVSAFTNDSGYLTLSTLPIWNGGVV